MSAYTNAWDALKKSVWLIHNDYLSLKGNSEQFTDHESDVKAAIALLDAPILNAASTALSAYRARRVANIRAGRALLDPLVTAFARVIDCPENDPTSVLRRLSDYMIAQSPDDTILTGGPTFGTASAVTGTGNPGLVRCTVDQYGYALETGAFNEVKTVKVIQDQASGTDAGSELWEWLGDNAGLDMVTPDGSGFRGTVPTLSGNSGSSLLRNSSFGELDGTDGGTLTSIPGWTALSALTNFHVQSTGTYRTANDESTAYALEFQASDTLYQALSTTGTAVQDPDNTPYCLSFRWNRNGTTGTLTGHLGASSQAVSVVAQSGWQHFYMDMDADLFYRGWKEDAPDVKLQLASASGAGLRVDDVYFGPLSRLGPPGRHTWLGIFAGSTDLLRGDYFTITDAYARTGIIARWLYELYGVYLPLAASSPTIAEPA